MPRRKLPPSEVLTRMFRSGMTHQEIADACSEMTGEKVTRVAVTLALGRLGEEKRQARYDAVLPWVVRETHANQMPARMLRVFGQRRAGKQLTQQWDERLNRWLRMLRDADLVVAYSPELGFMYVPAEESSDWVDDIPIRERELDLHEATWFVRHSVMSQKYNETVNI